jgi:transketolase
MTDAAPPSTRHAYRDWLVAAMANDRRMVCLDSDTGLFHGVDFGAAAQRYLNLGIAEQNMMGVAAGLAASGWRPYVNTMATFATTRAAEAVKIDIAYNALPVRIVATHAGVSAGHLGPTHHSLEDLAVMRTLPNLTVVVPADAAGTVSLLSQLAELPGPAYVRLGRKPTPALPVPASPQTARPVLDHPVLGRIEVFGSGRRVVIVCTGPLPVLHSLAAAEELRAGGLDTAVLHAHTVKPLDTATLLDRTAGADLVVTVEEHWRTGGLGSAVAEALTEQLAGAPPRPVLRIGMPDAFVSTVGTQQELLDAAGISVPGIVAAVGGVMQNRRTDQFATVE